MNKKFLTGVGVLAVAAVGLAWWWQNRDAGETGPRAMATAPGAARSLPGSPA